MSHRGQLSWINNTPSFHPHTMTPASSHSPHPKVVTPQRSALQDLTSEGIRKRVCKACDRCRLKKCKCDGSNPCSRCKANNTLCVFGERQKFRGKVYPKGYVEMLEQQQSQLVSGHQEMYRRLVAAQAWPGDILAETNGNPLTHDILAALNLRETKHDGSGEMAVFEDDCSKLQSRLISEGAGYTHRKGSVSSDSDHSQGHARSISSGTPNLPKPAAFPDFSAPPSPARAHSPMSTPRQRHSFAAQTSPLQRGSPLTFDLQFYESQWPHPESTNMVGLMRSKFALQPVELDQSPGSLDNPNALGQWVNSQASYDMEHDVMMPSLTSYPQQMSNAYTNLAKIHGGAVGPVAMDPMVDVDSYSKYAREFNQFISVLT